ncbi:dynamin family protein [Bacillus sp. ISL-47]|uniref:dynamin family protein n=1 Tax=Bacillus sp. ISL-47 TaxID=2819130 RepID=UPI001BE59E0C|nr:dynamin family protein [Bacillus sp. ISL-47]MBT2690089.1 dynamin family protein [Bacillus sp. ISL-47]MBT2707885.1 dynamin family protein [Pseudomonas sp. ISL-84]
MAETAMQPGLQQNELLNKITALYSYTNDHHDEQTAERAKDLARKLKDQEFAIAFCGHFSAGKSSMINKLAGEDLLPSSPIPTSANLVKVKSGEEDYAKVIFKEGKPRLYPAPYDYGQVKSYCKDGDLIQSIEISHSKTSLPKKAVIMDTPGIDSTDDAHRIATESALHLADLVFYVMDYNHVQSELNFLFTKELTEAGKEVYLVINQIDKHRDEELSFEHFKASVRDSFASWGVKPARIFYTSLKDEDHEENEFYPLQNFINESIANREALLPVSVFNSLKKLAEDHLKFLNEANASEKEKWEEKLSELGQQEREQLPAKLSNLETELTKLKTSIHTADIEVSDKIDEILKNAYLMPFQTRELAESYLESRQPEFKVGLFFSRQKTEQERQARLERFYQDFSEKVKAQLEWHLKELFLQQFKQHDIHDPGLLAQAQGFEMHFEPELLAKTVKTGAMVSGDYVLQYTNDTADAVKRIAKNSAAILKEALLAALKDKISHEQSRLEEDLFQLKKYAEALNALSSIREELQTAESQMHAYLAGEYSQDAFQEKAKVLVAEHVEEAEVVFLQEGQDGKEEQLKESVHNEEPPAAEDPLPSISVQPVIEKLNFTAQAVNDLPGFRKLAADLAGKASRLESKEFTVALFGAFSAGKSSFANALIGEKLLPVSPNPTTAAINKIKPISGENAHGTVLVKVKDSESLFNDVNHSLRVFDYTASNFDDAAAAIKKITGANQGFDANEKTHFAFLNAFLRGFHFFRELLGSTIKANLEEFKDYVANEEKSCFVETIEVYYDCELTRQGITLVDTPGADSINARHTGVAFEYIKNSDAILFVTYYNHAFSKADREFLIQLGRVKDTFALDKMFFIVNAIDLASNEEEKESVLDYVEDQLVQYGIRRPHLFGISSLQALSEKMEKNKDETSNISSFENSFYSFINQDLLNISITSAETEWKRLLGQLRAYISSSQENKDVRVQKLELLKDEHKTISDLLRKQKPELLSQRLEQETDELVFYIKQRVFLRFGDFVKEAFNPSLLKDDGRNLKKMLHAALDDFLSSFGFDFAQELRATTLRLETYISKLLGQQQESIAKSAANVNSDLSYSLFEPAALAGIEFESAFSNEDHAQFKKALSHFKNPKSFFERNERKQLADELEKNLQEPADRYLQAESARLKFHYNSLLTTEFERLLDSLLEQTNEYYEGITAALKDDFPIEELKEIEREIAQYEK